MTTNSNSSALGSSARVLRFAAGALLACAALCVQAFSLDDVAARARAMSQQAWKPASDTIAPALADLSYDDYRSIRFRPDHALWRDAGLPFELQFFHAGRGFRTPLKLHEIALGQPRALTIPRSSFDYGRAAKLVPSRGAADIAGFRVHYPIRQAGYKDEVIVFLGASYFRAVAADLHYGLSARALAVDTVGGSGEEFPAFEEFWIERPAADAQTLTLYALLNGPRVTGAYRFVITPGKPTSVDVQSRVFLRGPVATLGIAPLTSMFLAGENQPQRDDFRPEVHDSDGLQLLGSDGEWLWRPLVNPKQAHATSFAMQNPRGFGLMQRDRHFMSYEDLEARYDRRPSVWIEPQGDWGAGRVELFQFHTPDETNDNVVAYWVPQRRPAPGEALALDYRMRWGGDDLPHPPSSEAVQSRRGHGYHEGVLPADELQFNVDFNGPALKQLPADAPVEAIVTTDGNAQVLLANAYPNPVLGGWRMTLKLKRLAASRPVEMRAFLRSGTLILSETWSYSLPPE